MGEMGEHSIEVAARRVTELLPAAPTLVIRRVEDDMEWTAGHDPAPPPSQDLMLGNRLWEQQDNVAQDKLPLIVLAGLRRSVANRLVGTDCTDAALVEPPGKVSDDSPQPPQRRPREALPGGDLLTGFCMAEALGPRFFKNCQTNWWSNLRAFKSFMVAQGLPVNAHDSCWFLELYPVIQQNTLRFLDLPEFRARHALFIDGGIEELDLRQELNERQTGLVESRHYNGWDPSIARGGVPHRRLPVEAVFSRDRAPGVIASPQVYRLQCDGRVVDARTLAMEGRRVLPINDTRISWLARIVAQSECGAPDSATLYENWRLAVMAGTQFVDAALGTLFRNVRTYVMLPEEPEPSS